GAWPVVRQVRDRDAFGLGSTARSERTGDLAPDPGDSMVQSICPYCGVGCGQRIWSRDGKVTHVEGDPDSPISRGRLCPKGAATRGLLNASTREHRVRYRPPHGTEWEDLPLDRAMDMI